MMTWYFLDDLHYYRLYIFEIKTCLLCALYETNLASIGIVYFISFFYIIESCPNFIGHHMMYDELRIKFTLP